MLVQCDLKLFWLKNKLTNFALYYIVDDEIQSATASGRLAYTVPAITDIVGGAPIETFNTHWIADQSEKIKFRLSVDNTADATTSACPEDWEDKCNVEYSMRYTPLLHDISPSNVFFD